MSQSSAVKDMVMLQAIGSNKACPVHSQAMCSSDHLLQGYQHAAPAVDTMAQQSCSPFEQAWDAYQAVACVHPCACCLLG